MVNVLTFLSIGPNMTSDNRAMWQGLLFGAALALPVAVLTLAPRPGQQVAVIAAPWSGEAHAMRIAAAANTDIVATGRFAWIAIAAAPGSGGVARLYRNGALLVADAALFKTCFSLSFPETEIQI